MPIHPMNDRETSEIRIRLNELQVEHRDLDLAIACLIETSPSDNLLIPRLKKRKLLLRDRIAQLEQMLVPDIPA